MKKLSIIGFGRFGKTLYSLLRDDFEITLYNRSSINPSNVDLGNNARISDDLSEVYESEVIFYAVPISEFEIVIKNHSKFFRPEHLLIDVLTVKRFPAAIFKKYLIGKKTQAMLTHPMFGPDSVSPGFAGLPIIIDKYMSDDSSYIFWKKYFNSKKLRVVELSPDEHDKMAANSQGLTHFLGRLLEAFKMEETPIDTIGAQKLLDIKQQTCNDSWQLFTDLQHYNPYTKKMRLKLGEAYDNVYNKLLPKNVEPGILTIGIQGGKGSFNEEAVNYWLKRSDITKYEIKYLYTSEKVLASLHAGDIDYGQFAIHNSVGGIVGESVQAMAAYKFAIVQEFAIMISHALMVRKDAPYSQIKQVMAHPQVFAQCKSSLAQKYPHLELISGKGESIDHAFVAKQLSEGKISIDTATMGSKILAEIYDLAVIEDNLQDAVENYTSFLIVSR